MTIHHVLIAHTAVAADADPSTSDILDQVALIREGLLALEIPFEIAAVDEYRVWEEVRPFPDLVVVNLLEAPPGLAHLHAAATAALELLQVPFTGSSAAAMWLTTDKIATRASLVNAGLPVAPGGRWNLTNPDIFNQVPPPWILKPAWEDASIGIEGDPVCRTIEQALSKGKNLTHRFPGQPILVEHFLTGREFNVSLLANDTGASALPVAEIAFVDFPPDVPALVNYEAKWVTGSFADTHTVRCFPGNEDRKLMDQLQELALAAWDVCGLTGYARVDFRLDEHGFPAILEVNANPCLSADAGFMAAARLAGLSAADITRRILTAAILRHKTEMLSP